MDRRLGIWMAAAAVLVSAAAGPAGAKEVCKVVLETADGKKLAPELPDRYIETLPGQLSLPPDIGKATFIGCRRDALVLKPSDIRVLTELRIPFGIIRGGDTVAFWEKDGRILWGLAEGAITPAEEAMVQAWVVQAQVRLTAALRPRD